MSDFLNELNNVSRSKEAVAEAMQREYEKNIINNMIPDKEILNEFDEMFINNIKFVIKDKAHMGDYTPLEDNKRRIVGTFSLVKKFLAESVGADHFNGIKFENTSIRMHAPFETNMIVYEPTTFTKLNMFKIDGYKIYANTIIKKHLIDILKNENIIITKIDNFPENSDFVSVKNFEKKYINRTITFHYQITY